MRACNVDVVERSAERGMGGETLWTWHKFRGTGISQTYKGKEEFKVATTGAEVVITWEVLKTDLCTKACLEAGFVYWYLDVVLTFTTLAGGTETVLIKRLDKTTLNTLRQTLTAHSLKCITEALQIVWFTETWTHSFLAPREELETEHLETGLMEGMYEGFWIGLIKELWTDL